MMTLVISLVLAVLAITGALHALLSKRDSKSALAWVAFCLLLPLLGPVTYLIFGINRTISKAQRTYLVKTEEDAADIILEPAGTQLRPLSLVGEKVTGHGLRSCDDIQVLENGEALYPAILAAIDAARESVYCATYIFQNDETGSTFVAAFSRAQERGVDVRIIIDGLGAIAYWPRVSRSLAKHKLNFKHFNPIRLFPPSLNINLRNHRKILVIDDHCAFTGGQNIGDRHLVDQVENTIPPR
ncbi:MAG: phospholipase D-like domain-containing protein, partial [Pseudomonadales bacterium]|nr:phospholipase D-like domain-containing protein [Pseudomonadales bacterium]